MLFSVHALQSNMLLCAICVLEGLSVLLLHAKVDKNTGYQNALSHRKLFIPVPYLQLQNVNVSVCKIKTTLTTNV